MSTTDLIREAYIEPIRSVMVVDDEYPTMEKLLSGYDEEIGEVTGSKKVLESRDKNNLLEVINLCRDSQNNWMLDVHDGDFSGQETGAVNNLHHSDLLILDYHLEGNGDDGRGEQALKILSSLARKEHFNLVVVHTKGYGGANGDYAAVFNDIVFELQSSKIFKGIPQNLKSPVEEAINIWTEENENILDELVNSVSDFDYLSLHDAFNAPIKIPHVMKELLALKQLFDSRPMDDRELIDLQLRFLIWFVLCEKGANLSAKFGDEDFNGFKWCIEDGSNWVKTENLFVTVVGKDVPTSELPVKLLESLESWRPHPNRLLMAKLRHQLDEKGASVANSLITRQHVQAGWLKELLSTEELFSDQKAWGCIQNHMEELSYSFKDELCEYLARLMHPLSEASKNHARLELEKQGIDTTSREPDTDQEKEAIQKVTENSINHVLGSFTPLEVLQDSFLMFKEVNAFNNSMAIEGKHLVTGHVLRSPSGNFFLVVTPVCDLVPGRSKHGKIEIQAQLLYPVNVALQQIDGENSLDAETIYSRAKLLVNTKKLLFLPLEKEVEVLSSLYNVYGNSEPKVCSIIIDGDGVWDDERKLKVYESDLSRDVPRYKECEYQVVAQLRYEYALHHSKVSGEYHSRIGLDYQ